MKHRLEAAVLSALALLAIGPAAAAKEGWPRCGRDDECPGFYLSVVTLQGDARLSVGRTCSGDWRHVWGRRDARETIQQWLHDAADEGRGRLCIPLHPDVDEVRVTSTGGDCGYGRGDVSATASQPGRGTVLRRSAGGASALLPGCHATIGNEATGIVAYGGVAVDFADGHTFGDSYARDYFYGVYDGHTSGRVRSFGASVAAIGQFNTYRYRVEILARGRDDWTWGNPEENGK